MSRHLSFLIYGKAVGGQVKVRTGLGKSDRPESQGGLRKRGPWWNYEPAAHTERVHVGNSPPVGCARRISIPTPKMH